MKALKHSHDKIQEICEILKKESLDPARKEASAILESAHQEALRIKHKAALEAETLLLQAKQAREQEYALFQSSLAQAARQSVEALRQSVLTRLFNPEIEAQVQQGSGSPDIVAQLIKAIVSALDKEGIFAPLSAYIPQHLAAEDVNRQLASNVLEKLKNKSVEVGSFKGGAQVKLNQKGMTIDITDSALKELLAAYLKKPEFRNLIFQAE